MLTSLLGQYMAHYSRHKIIMINRELQLAHIKWPRRHLRYPHINNSRSQNRFPRLSLVGHVVEPEIHLSSPIQINALVNEFFKRIMRLAGRHIQTQCVLQVTDIIGTIQLARGENGPGCDK